MIHSPLEMTSYLENSNRGDISVSYLQLSNICYFKQSLSMTLGAVIYYDLGPW